MSLPGILHLTVSEIEPRQDFQTQGHYGKVKGHIKVNHDIAHLHILTNIPTKYQLPTPYGFWDTAGTNFFPPPAHPDTMGENNTPAALKGCEVIKAVQNFHGHICILLTHYICWKN